MATVKAILNTKYKSKDGYPIGIRLIDGKKQRFHAIGEKIEEKYWQDGQVSKKHPDARRINSIIDDEIYKAKTYFSDCRQKGKPVDLDLVFSEVKSHSFIDYLRHRQEQHKALDQVNMEDKVKRFIKELQAVGGNVYFSDLTQDFLRKFEIWLRDPDGKRTSKGNTSNTIHKKMEFLGKYWNNAKEEGKVDGQNPFEVYKKTIKTTPAVKPKLTVEQFKRIEALQLDPGATDFARDLWLFAYYCRGIRFQTCISMKKTSIVGNRLLFKANKGEKQMSALIHPRMQAIIDKYIHNETEYIFGKPVDLSTGRKKKSTVGSWNTVVNRELKTVAALAEVPIDLTFHISRHTLAYHLKKNKSDIHVIKDTLGHSRTNTTEIYLASLDDEYLDNELSVVYK